MNVDVDEKGGRWKNTAFLVRLEKAPAIAGNLALFASALAAATDSGCLRSSLLGAVCHWSAGSNSTPLLRRLLDMSTRLCDAR